MIKIPEWHKDHTTQDVTLDNKVWSVARLVELSKSLPVFDAHLSSMCLRYEFDCDMMDFLMHMNAVKNASLDYPIILSADGCIMDGRHRVMKAILEGKETIKAVRFDELPPPCRLKD